MDLNALRAMQTNKRNEDSFARCHTIKIAYINKKKSDFLKANVSFNNWQEHFCMALVFSLQL